MSHLEEVQKVREILEKAFNTKITESEVQEAWERLNKRINEEHRETR